MGETPRDKCLGDYVTLQRGNTYKSALLGRPGPVLLGLASIARNGGFRADNLKTYGGVSDKRIILQPGDIYVSLKDVTQSADLLGAVSRVPGFIAAGRLTQDTVKLAFKSDDAPKNYIYWLLRTPEYRAYCKAHSTGTTNLGLAREDFFSFPVPALTNERTTLVAIIQSIEDKIQLYRHMNETLEALARAIFKDWFVDFGPTLAKAEGRPAYLTPAMWALFPDALDAEGKPEGWDSSEIGKEARCVGGSTPSTADPSLWNGGVQWATPKDLSSLKTPVLLSTERTISQKGLDKITSGLLPVGTVLLSSRAPIGYLAISEVPVAINQGFIALVPEGRLSNVFVWQWVIANMAAILQKANGSTFQEISKSNFRPLPVTVPSAPLLKAFDEIARSLYERIRGNEIETRSLVALRDFLLPKLMSGEIRLREAEKLVKKVS